MVGIHSFWCENAEMRTWIFRDVGGLVRMAHHSMTHHRGNDWASHLQFSTKIISQPTVDYV